MTKSKIGEVINAMISYYSGDVRRINHFLKVYSFAKTIGEMENLTEETQNILEIAAVTHDIGIKISEQKYNSCAGNYQQIEGPPEAKELLSSLNIESEIIERVCYLIAHHHTYHNIVEMDYQILVEADFLVNAYEDNMDDVAIEKVKNKLFRTETGKKLLEQMYIKPL
ncbi:HD domain-containing protein [Candidatus Galacturonibacter soehngenii]|uniref:HD domain-containing protein n=1 Tax=Candidatus Galacturonatibacter soehngenii TaxID=2307010 RepID=A0A7V7QJK6_9FIRM|nr:HD domain-containing protein [Candidatus Galacturonibacter soehngenii]KAB1437804.1 HD domain-containing protein [Candidatus Galacturonibacter soehngenii]KAB1437807.1 HD domain-containing protein [Candidatus Galacturonibacter soehngenii]